MNEAPGTFSIAPLPSERTPARTVKNVVSDPAVDEQGLSKKVTVAASAWSLASGFGECLPATISSQYHGASSCITAVFGGPQKGAVPTKQLAPATSSH